MLKPLNPVINYFKQDVIINRFLCDSWGEISRAATVLEKRKQRRMKVQQVHICPIRRKNGSSAVLHEITSVKHKSLAKPQWVKQNCGQSSQGFHVAAHGKSDGSPSHHQICVADFHLCLIYSALIIPCCPVCHNSRQGMCKSGELNQVISCCPACVLTQGFGRICVWISTTHFKCQHLLHFRINLPQHFHCLNFWCDFDLQLLLY